MNQTRRSDHFEPRARELALAAGMDPDARVPKPGTAKTWPAWCEYRGQAQLEQAATRTAVAAQTMEAAHAAQPMRYRQAKLEVFGEHEGNTISQMHDCMRVGPVVAGVLCADGHLGYSQPVGGVIAYEGAISISGVGFDIACGNMAIKLDTTYSEVRNRIPELLADIGRAVSFGIGRANGERAHHPLLDDDDAWRAADREDYRQKAASQLGTVGSGNHYVDLLREEIINTTDLPEHVWGDLAPVWIGIHFGSRGFGHSSATHYLKAAGGRDGINAPATIVADTSELGVRYLAAMHLAGRYAYAGREWVAERVRKIVGGKVLDTIHNHHNFAWKEQHGDRDLWVVRKGATPAFPGERGFVGGSMGDDAVILEGVDSPASAAALYSTVHGAGRTFGRKEAKRRFSREEMDGWLRGRGVHLLGGDLDESPMAYRRLPDVLRHHEGTVKVLHTLRPFAVAMAGQGDFDPWKD